MKNKIIAIIATVCLLGAGYIGAVLFLSSSQQSVEANLLIPPNAPQKGSNNPAVEIVEFLDPQCESCRTFYPIVNRILEKYPDKLRLTIRYVPFHEYSDFAIKVLEASRKQTKYWETLRVVFKYQPYWGGHHNAKPEVLWRMLPEAQLDLVKLQEDMGDPRLLDLIKRDQEDASKLGVQKTPSFFVNGIKLKKFGEQPLIELIESQL